MDLWMCQCARGNDELRFTNDELESSEFFTRDKGNLLTRSFVDILSFVLIQKKERKKKSSAKERLRPFARHTRIRAVCVWTGGSKDTRSWGTHRDGRKSLVG
jgi:hypothetical protein